MSNKAEANQAATTAPIDMSTSATKKRDTKTVVLIAGFGILVQVLIVVVLMSWMNQDPQEAFVGHWKQTNGGQIELHITEGKIEKIDPKASSENAVMQYMLHTTPASAKELYIRGKYADGKNWAMSTELGYDWRITFSSNYEKMTVAAKDDNSAKITTTEYELVK